MHRLLMLALLTLAPAREATAQLTFDHGLFDAVLRAHVQDGLVDYDGVAGDARFERYLGQLGSADPRTLPREEQLAFWINAYNAYTLKLILKHGERKSIRNINKTLFFKAYGPWKEKLAVIGGRAYGLDEIEQGIIRPEFREPRIHFALVCAALGCPPLRSEAYVGARLEAQLQEQGHRFLRESPAKNRVDVAARRVYLSQVFRFRDYEQDFGGTEAAIGRYVAQWYPPGPERDLLESGDFTVRYTEYDWALNTRSAAR